MEGSGRSRDVPALSVMFGIKRAVDGTRGLLVFLESIWKILRYRGVAERRSRSCEWRYVVGLDKNRSFGLELTNEKERLA